jgi:uncharacterized membrane protein YgdD (TMEM256/DUF423 family)
LGAYGAHGLAGGLESLGYSEPEIAMRAVDRFAPAVHYQMVHSVALAVIAVLGMVRPSGLLKVAGGAFLVGILLFSGLLYVLTFTDYSWLGALVPVGGVAYILGWVLLAVEGLRRGNRADP